MLQVSIAEKIETEKHFTWYKNPAIVVSLSDRALYFILFFLS